MKKSKIYKKLEIIGNVFTHTYSITNNMMKLYQEEKIKLISSEWKDGFKQKHPDLYPLDLNKQELWCTYDKCTNINLSLKDGKIIIEVTIYEGDMLEGFPKSQRWSGKFEITQYHLKYFKSPINWKFNKYLEDLYEREQELKKQQRILQFEKEMLA
jgi:hypothetical protein